MKSFAETALKKIIKKQKSLIMQWSYQCSDRCFTVLVLKHSCTAYLTLSLYYSTLFVLYIDPKAVLLTSTEVFHAWELQSSLALRIWGCFGIIGVKNLSTSWKDQHLSSIFSYNLTSLDKTLNCEYLIVPR